MPEKIFILESRGSLGSAASLASGAGAFGVHTAALGSAAPPIRFPSCATRSCSLPSTDLCAHQKKTNQKSSRPHHFVGIIHQSESPATRRKLTGERKREAAARTVEEAALRLRRGERKEDPVPDAAAVAAMGCRWRARLGFWEWEGACAWMGEASSPGCLFRGRGWRRWRRRRRCRSGDRVAVLFMDGRMDSFSAVLNRGSVRGAWS